MGVYMKKYLSVVCLALVLFLWTGCSKVEELKEAYQKGDLEKVLQIAQELSEEQPHNPDLHFYIGQAYENLGRLREALKEYELVLILRPHYDSKYGNKEEVQKRISKIKEQLAQEEEKRKEKEKLVAFKRLAEIPVEKENAKELSQAYTEALSFKQDTAILLQGIYDLAGIGKVDLAYNLYERFKDKAEDIDEVINPKKENYFAEAKKKIPQIQAQKIGQGANIEGLITLYYLADDSGLLYMINTGQSSNNMYLYHFAIQTKKNEQILCGSWKQEEGQFKTLLDGRILYCDGSKIIILNGETFKIEKEVTLPDDVKYVDVSYDGRKVVYTKGNSGLWVDTLDFQEPQRILARDEETTQGFEPRWSRWNRDSTKIAYIEYSGKSPAGVGVIYEDGSNKVFKEMANVYEPIWFPDGEKIAVATNSDGAESGESWIWYITKNSVKQISKMKGINAVAISHKGERVSFLKFCGIGYNLWIKDLITEKESLIGGNIGVIDYAWSADDKKVVYAVKSGKGKPYTFWLSNIK